MSVIFIKRIEQVVLKFGAKFLFLVEEHYFTKKRWRRYKLCFTSKRK